MEVETSQELLLLCALRRGEPVSESTVNMKCPVVINDQSRRAVQVMEQSDYTMRHRLGSFPNGGAE